MQTNVKPPLEDLYLEHFGVKGMRWGHRKAKLTPTEAKRRTKRLKIAAGVVGVAAGAAAVAYLMRNRGKVPVRNVLGHNPGLPGAGSAARGQRAANDISQSEWRRRVSSLRADISKGHADQDRWMRKQGLGAAVNQANLDSVRRNLQDPNYVWEI